MNNIILHNTKQVKRVKSLVKSECCNYDNGKCILLDDGSSHVCPQLISLSLICKWFRIAVLPLDEELHIQLVKQKNTRQCVHCGIAFVKASNSSKYCDKCRIIVRKKKKTEYERKRRFRNGQIEP